MNKLLVITGLLSLLVTASCQDTKLQTSTPSSEDMDRKEEPRKTADDKVDPPVPVNGVWLHAQVLEESNVNGRFTATLGIASYNKGVRISDHRDRFMVTLSASQNANTGTNITQEEVLTGDYDHRVKVEGTSPAQVRSAYPSIMLYVTIFDRSDNTTDTWSSPLEAVLVKSNVKQSVSSQSTSSTSTAGQTGTAGSPSTLVPAN
ncbi:MAG TPA: hypothetical protein VFO10_10210 [Oligoflexus sp.]|uniref:hypothetical protein n=1 Tax=Oligoflexus sp. TaxID=1971216 RepID=UPI002D80A287|nr:hypothetical protein [Oligoflexus sp.]HET9237615.1 hypothetical protein [Oligoflexus sp.]